MLVNFKGFYFAVAAGWSFGKLARKMKELEEEKNLVIVSLLLEKVVGLEKRVIYLLVYENERERKRESYI